MWLFFIFELLCNSVMKEFVMLFWVVWFICWCIWGKLVVCLMVVLCISWIINILVLFWIVEEVCFCLSFIVVVIICGLLFKLGIVVWLKVVLWMVFIWVENWLVSVGNDLFWICEVMLVVFFLVNIVVLIFVCILLRFGVFGWWIFFRLIIMYLLL